MKHGCGFQLGETRSATDELAERAQIFEIVRGARSRERAQHRCREFPRRGSFRDDGGNVPARAQIAKHFEACPETKPAAAGAPLFSPSENTPSLFNAAMRSRKNAESRPEISKMNRSIFDETRMSIDGELVMRNARRVSYSPVRMKSATTQFSFDATTKRRIGAPSFFA